MAGTIKTSTIQNDVNATATVFKDGAGNEIGRFLRAFHNTDVSNNILATFNVSSLTVIATGIYKPTFTLAFSDANYAWSGMAHPTAADRGCTLAQAATTDNATIGAQTSTYTYYKIAATTSGTSYAEPHGFMATR